MQIFRPTNVTVLAVDVETSERWSESGWRLFRFDITRALGPQLKEAERQLNAIQKGYSGKINTPQPRRDNWPLYLRALDAKDAGASYDLMCKAFWPDDFEKKTAQSARDTYEAADRLRNNFPI